MNYDEALKQLMIHVPAVLDILQSNGSGRAQMATTVSDLATQNVRLADQNVTLCQYILEQAERQHQTQTRPPATGTDP